LRADPIFAVAIQEHTVSSDSNKAHADKAAYIFHVRLVALAEQISHPVLII
jgi:hypothetical protein